MFFKEKPNIKDEIKQRLNKNKSARMSDVYNFEIDDSEVQVIETDDYHVYTFHISSPSSEYMIKNYILVEYSIDSIRHFIADYQYEVVDDEKIFNSQPTLIEINNPNFSSSTNRPNTNISSDCEWVAYFTTETIFIQGNRCGCDGKHLYGDPECNCPNSPPTPGTNQTVNSITWKLECYTPGGGPTNPDPGNGSGGGGGSGDGNSGDEILTVPFDKDDGNLELDNCGKINNMMKPEFENLVEDINLLKAHINESGVERSISYKKTIDGESMPTISKLHAVGTHNSVKITTGGFFYGSIHVHPNGKIPMFSWRDMRLLAETYSETFSSRKKDVFMMIVCPNDLVYCLKIDNPQAFIDKVNEFWSNPKLGNTEEKKITNANKIIFRKYDSDTNKERAFLKYFKNFGISIYKADQSVSNWSKLSLNESNNLIVSEPCN